MKKAYLILILALLIAPIVSIGQCSAPTTQASGFTAGASTANSRTISWTRGNGNKVLVIAKEGSAPVDPTSGTAYSANAIFQVGDQVNNDGFVVYDGTGTSVNVTSLKPSTTYYFAIYEYNTTGTCYNLTELTGNASTSACTSPSTQASGFGTSSVTSTTMNVSWVRGNGNKVLVIARAGSAPSDPTNGIDYTPSAAFGSGAAVGGGYAVYNGVATAVSLAALYPGTTYHFAFYEYNTTNLCYNLVQHTGNQTTTGCTAPTTQASGFTVNSVNNKSMTISWTRGNGNKVLIVALEGSAPSAPQNGVSYGADSDYKKGDKVSNNGYVVYNGTGTNVTIEKLKKNTTYYYSLYEYNTTTKCYKSPALTGNVTTECEPPSKGPQSHNLLSRTHNSISIDWSGHDYSDGFLVVAKAGSAPSSDPTVGNSYTANQVYGSGGALGGGFVVYDNTTSSSTITGLSANTTYYFNIYSYSMPGNCYNLTEYSCSITTLCGPPTTQASSFGTSSITDSSMTVSWTRGNGDKVLVIALKGSAPSDPTIGASYTANTTYGLGTRIGDGYVVYDGTGTSVNVTGLSSSKNYYYAIYEYFTAGNCFNLTELTGVGSTVSCSSPSTQASAFSTSAVTSNSMTASWTRGNGNKVLVLAKAGSAPSDPTNGLAYVANASYGLGDAVGGGFAVYNGTGTSVNITSLSNSTTCYFAVYEYTSSGYCYNLIELSGNASTTACTAPSTQASAFVANTITPVSMKVNWTRGDGNQVLVIAKEGSTPSNPTNGATYTSSSLYGSGTSVGGGYVVYEGSGTSVTVTGLSASTTYYYNIYEYSTSQKCYNLSSLSGNASTTAAGCTPPSTQASASSVGSITSTTMTVGWTRGNGNNILVIAKAGSRNLIDPTNGTSYSASSTFGSGDMIGGGYIVYNGAGTSVSLTGLTSGATYYFSMYEYNSTGTCYNLSELTGSGTTSATPTAGEGAGAGSGPVAASAMFDINATDKGILLPRVSLTGTNDVTTIANPATSLTVYNTNTTALGNEYDVVPGFYYWDGNVWSTFYDAVTPTPGWMKLGNDATVLGTNFIGTIDDVDVTFRRDNTEKLRIKNSTLEFLNNGQSVYVGEGAGEAMGTGSDYGNVAIGFQPLKLGTTASKSIAIGHQALYSFNGSNGIAIGRNAQYLNTSGNSNISIGLFSSYSTTGERNIAIGDSSLYANAAGSNNIAFGAGALRNGIAPSHQIALGRGALLNATDATYNIGLGYYAGAGITFGSQNIAIGAFASLNNAESSNNISIGYEAGYSENLGNNVFIGNYAGKLNNGSGNVFIGHQAGTNEGGSDKLYIDNSSTSTPLIWGDFSTSVRRVGINRVATANTLEVSGEASKTTASAWAANSDRRIKTDIQDIENATDVIMKLHPVKFKYSKEWKNRTPYLKENDHYYYNFIAQEFQLIFPESVKGSGEFLKGDNVEILQIDTYNTQIFAVKALQEQQFLIDKNKKYLDRESLNTSAAKDGGVNSFEEKLLLLKRSIKDLEK